MIPPKKTKKQLKRELRDKILVETILNKDNESCSDSESLRKV